MREFAYGVTNDNAHYGAARNPWDKTRVSGGSSGGSAAAVASSQCTASLGTDTGGSIRIPSAVCGVVGLKPTYGRVSRYGAIPLAWSLDHVGPITNSVYDAALMLQVISDYVSSKYDSPYPGAGRPARSLVSAFDEFPPNLRIGVPRAFFFDDLHPEIADAIGSKMEIMFDGGIRSGQDVMRALALGAKSCMIGRAYVYGLGAAGEAGVAKAIEILAKELTTTMGLCGVNTVAEIGDHVLAV